MMSSCWRRVACQRVASFRSPTMGAREVHLGTLIDRIPIKNTNVRALLAAAVIMSIPAVWKSTRAESASRGECAGPRVRSASLRARALVLTQYTAFHCIAAPPCAEVKEGHGLFDSDMPEEVRVQRDSAKGLAIKAHTSEYHK